MTTNDTRTARERAEEQAVERYNGPISRLAFIAGFLARDAEPTTVTAEQITDEIYKVTSNWDEPLDEVHDIPQITSALLARFRIEGDEA